jgi:hypothetical protein
MVYFRGERRSNAIHESTADPELRMMAGFGGFSGWKCDGESDPQTVWIGLQWARDFTLAIQAQSAIRTSKIYA